MPDKSFNPDNIPKTDGNNKASKGGEIPFANIPNAPDGYIAVEIETGVANEDYTEVKKGLTEGQEIYRQSTVSTSNSSRMMNGMGGMSGGMSGGMGGSRPSGSMSGAPRSGGMGGMR